MLKFFTKKEKMPWLAILMLFCTLCFDTTAYAQTRPISGTVTDSKNEPLPGVTLRVKNTTAATMTDINGKFTLKVPDGQNTIVASYLGFTTQEVAISGSSINIKLTESQSQLNEVIVVGYGTQKKSN